MKCATCRGPVAKLDPLPGHFPFCSERCQLIDLGRWLGEEYRVPEPPEQSEMSSDGESETGGS